MNRAERRYRTQVKKLNAQRKLKDKESEYFSYDDKRLGMFTETPQCCSCRGCGNQRKYEGLTLSEKRSIDSNPV